MTQTVTDEQGAIHSFPDEASPAQIAEALGGQHQPPAEQMTGAARAVALPASNLVKGLVGAASLPGEAVNSAANLYSKYVGAPVANLYGQIAGTGKTTEPWNVTNPYDTAALTGTFQRMGAIDRPDLVPQTEGERLVAGAAQGVGGAVPFAFGGGIPAAAQALATGAGAGLGGELGSQYEAHPIAGRILGALAGGASASGLTGALQNLVAKAGNWNVGSPVQQAYQQAGVDPVLAGDVTGNTSLQRIQSAGAQIPGGGRIREAAKTAIDQFGNSIEDTAQNLGNSKTLQEAGSALQMSAQGWLQNFKAQGQKLWSNVGMYVAPTDKVSIANYDAALEGIGKTLEDAPKTAKALQPGLSRTLFNALQNDAGSAGTLSWKSVQGIRTRIGEMLSDPQVVADTSTSELKRLYGALTQDMQTAVAARGPDAVNAFNAATSFTRQGHDLLDAGLGQVLKKGVSPENAARFVLSGNQNGGTFLQMLRNEVPQGADELAAYKLRDMASANPGQQNASGTAVSPSKFSTEINRMSPEAAQALFADPAAASKVNALGVVGRSMKGTTESLGGKSQTAPMVATELALGMPVAMAEGAARGYEHGGLLGALGGAASGAVVPFAPGLLSSRITASPGLTRFLATPGSALPMAPNYGLLATQAASGLLGPTNSR